MSGTDAREQPAKPAGQPTTAGGQAEGPVPGLAPGSHPAAGDGAAGPTRRVSPRDLLRG